MTDVSSSVAIDAQNETWVPEDVRELLGVAFGESAVGETAWTQGHLVDKRWQVIRSEDGDPIADMLYGELLPEGVSKALTRLGAKAATGGWSVLELGMGTGKVAFQAFFQCPGIRQVIGIELSPDRYELAVAAAVRLAEGCSARFSSRDVESSEIAQLLGTAEQVVRGHVLEEHGTDRRVWLLEGDLAVFACPGGPVEEAQAVFFQLCLPPEVRDRTYRILNRAPDGCRIFSLDNIAWQWTLPENSVLHPVDSVGEGLIAGDREHFLTSWSTKNGSPFCVFEVDRRRSPTITSEFAIQYVQDLYANAYF